LRALAVGLGRWSDCLSAWNCDLTSWSMSRSSVICHTRPVSSGGNSPAKNRRRKITKVVRLIKHIQKGCPLSSKLQIVIPTFLTMSENVDILSVGWKLTCLGC